MNIKSTSAGALSFFAAANGYSGFRSYFKEVFNPSKYEAIYILKGGPGTGKSTLMKRLITELKPDVDQCEAIYCSSDIASLDGVIIKNGEKSVAVVDGTSPHALDPVFPGAVDRIINLGEHWDEKILSDCRKEIEAISRAKARAYECAYDYLRISGALTEKVDVAINEIYTQEDAAVIASLLPERLNAAGNAKVRLLTSYGKDGFGRLDTLPRIAGDVYSAVGVYGSEYVFMSRLHRALECTGYDYILFPSVLDGRKIYALFIPRTGTAIVAERLSSVPDERVIDTVRFLNQAALSEERDRLEFLWREREAFLWSSADQFKRASSEHFKLEKIYSAAMDFSKNDEQYELCTADIRKKLLL